jgi:hypothetical protein
MSRPHTNAFEAVLSRHDDNDELLPDGRDGVRRFIKDEYGIDVTDNAIVQATYYKRTLRRTKVGRRVAYSKGDVRVFMETCKRGGEGPL